MTRMIAKIRLSPNVLPLGHKYKPAVKQGLVTQNLPKNSQPLHSVMEEVEGREEKVITPVEDSISMTGDMLKNIVANALEEQKKLADANSKEAIKTAYTEGMKKGCELQVKRLLSSTLGQEMGNY